MLRMSSAWIYNCGLAIMMAVPVIHGGRTNAAEVADTSAMQHLEISSMPLVDNEDHTDLHSDGDLSVNEDGGASSRDRQLNSDCRWYDGRPYDCQRFAGCFYDYRWNQCLSRGGGGQPYPPPPYPPQPYFCQQFNYNQFECQRQGCFFDYRSQLCFAQGGGVPQPLPPPGRRGIVCTAVDSNWEEHHRGHQGFGQTHYAAQQAAMGDCLRFHHQCHITQCQYY
jgi:hypothetical protein